MGSTYMRWLRTLAWGIAGALPGAIAFAIPAIIESERENLALIIAGLVLAIIGFVVGVVAGWHQVPAQRRSVVLGGVVGAVVGVVLFYASTYVDLQGVFGLAVLMISPIIGIVVAARRLSSNTKSQYPAGCYLHGCA